MHWNCCKYHVVCQNYPDFPRENLWPFDVANVHGATAPDTFFPTSLWGSCFLRLHPVVRVRRPPSAAPPVHLISSHHSSHPQLISYSSHTTHLTALITQPLISHHASHTTHHTPLITHHSSHAAHLTQLISHQSCHSIYLTPRASNHSSHTTHLTPLTSNHSSQIHLTPFLSQPSSHNHSSYTSHLTPLISQHSSHTTHLSPFIS